MLLATCWRFGRHFDVKPTLRPTTPPKTIYILFLALWLLVSRIDGDPVANISSFEDVYTAIYIYMYVCIFFFFVGFENTAQTPSCSARTYSCRVRTSLLNTARTPSRTARRKVIRFHMLHGQRPHPQAVPRQPPKGTFLEAYGSHTQCLEPNVLVLRQTCDVLDCFTFALGQRSPAKFASFKLLPRQRPDPHPQASPGHA